MAIELTAYVFGDVTLTTKLLSQVAMIFGGGAFATAAKVAVLGGVIGGLFSSLSQRGQVNVMTFVWPFIVLLFGIMPRVDVVMEDPSGGLSRVSNVPVLVAGPFSIITHVGRGLTDMVETSMAGTSGDVSISMENGTIVGLRAPLAIEEVLTNEAAGGAALRLPNGLNLMTDTKKYVADCLAPALQKGTLSGEKVYNQSISLWGATTYPFPVVGTDGVARTCATYYSAIFDQLGTSAFTKSLRSALNVRFGRYKDDTTTGARYDQALQRLVSDPQAFYRAVVLSAALGKTAADYTVAGSGGSQEAALQDALKQRREGSRGKAAMMFETIHQMVGFIEAWSFCIMPLMVLVMLLGPSGTRLGAKYFWLLIWVQLWFPTILIVLGYLDAQSINLATKSVGTIAGANAFLEAMLKLQDVGYMYLSMATMMSMFLIYGASAVFGTALQGMMDGGAAYDAKKNAPDTLSRGPETVFKPSYEFANASGYIGTDAAKSFGNVTFQLDRARSQGTTLQELASFARTGQRSVADATTNTTTYSSGDSTSLIDGNNRTTTVRDGRSVEMSTGSQISAGATVGDGAGNAATRANTDSTTWQGNVGVQGGVTGTMGTPGASVAGVGAGASGGLTGSYGRTTQDSESEQSIVRRDTQESSDVKQTNDLGMGQKGSASRDETASDSHSAQDVEQDSTALNGSEGRTATSTDSESATDSSSEASTSGSMVTRSARIGGIDGMAWANNIARSQEGMGELRHAVMQAGLIPDVDRFMSENQDRLDMTFRDEDAKYAFAAQYVMQQGGLRGQTAEQQDAMNALGDHFIDKYSFGLLDVAGPQGGVDQHGLVPGASDVSDGFAGTKEEFQRKLGSVTDLISLSTAGADVSDELDKSIYRMRQEFGGDNKAAIDSLFSTARRALESREDFYGAEEAQGFFGKISDQGLWTALSTAGSTKEEYQASVLGKTYREDAEGAESAEELLARRLERFGEAGQMNADGPAARYMAATQLYIGAKGEGDETRAAEFQGMMANMERQNPALEGWAGEQIRGFAADGAMRPEGGISDRLTAAQAAYDFGLRKEEMEQKLGIEINDTMTASEISSLGAAPAGGEVAPQRMSGNKQDFIQAMMPHAERVSERTGVDARIIVAQAALESNWGKSAPGNNYFGIKSHGAEGGNTLSTTEVINGKTVRINDSFRAYGSMAESVEGYGDFIMRNRRYAAMRNAPDIDSQIAALGASGYATDPNYARKIGSIAKSI